MNTKQRATQIREAFGQKEVDLVVNRHRGGQSGAKGIRYEDMFAISRLATLARDYLEEGRDAKIAGQVFSFVDDLEIFKETAGYKENYQIKNSPNIKWGHGEGSITVDFRNQHLLNDKCGYRSTIKLIVSDLDTATRLQENLPDDIKHFTIAEHFHYCEKLSQLIKIDSEFKQVMSYLCARPDQLDKVETVALNLLSTWIDSSAPRGEYVEISDLIATAKLRCPSFIRLVGECPTLRGEVEEILNAIPDFRYFIEKGFFSWQYLNGLDSGILAYDCLDFRFNKFQDLVLKNRPMSFDELEGLLL